MALIWLFSRQVPIALLPFAVFSIFHVATYSRSVLIPTFMPPTQSNGVAGAPVKSSSPLAETIGKFIKEYYDTSMGLVALLEVVTWFRLLIPFLSFTRGAIFLFLAYTAFLRARYAQSGFVQNAVSNLTARVDAMVANQGTPPVARQAWGTFKGVMRQAADVTDVSRYIGGAGVGTGPKKAQ